MSKFLLRRLPWKPGGQQRVRKMGGWDPHAEVDRHKWVPDESAWPIWKVALAFASFPAGCYLFKRFYIDRNRELRKEWKLKREAIKAEEAAKIASGEIEAPEKPLYINPVLEPEYEHENFITAWMRRIEEKQRVKYWEVLTNHLRTEQQKMYEHIERKKFPNYPQNLPTYGQIFHQRIDRIRDPIVNAPSGMDD